MKVALEHVGVEDAHDQFFAKRGGQCRAAQLDLGAARRPGLDAAVLRATLFGKVHARQHFQAAGDRRHDRSGDLVNVVEGAVDAEAHAAMFATWFQVNVAGATLEGVLQQPVDDGDDGLGFGIELPAARQFDQLFEILQGAGHGAAAAHRLGALDRSRQGIKLRQIALDVLRVGEHPFDGPANGCAQVILPFGPVRLCGGDDHLVVTDRQRQDAGAAGIGKRHQRGDCPRIEAQRVDLLIAQATLGGEPLCEAVGGPDRAGVGKVRQRLIGDQRNRVTLRADLRLTHPAVLGAGGVQPLCGNQGIQQRAQVQAAAGECTSKG